MMCNMYCDALACNKGCGQTFCSVFTRVQTKPPFPLILDETLNG